MSERYQLFGIRHHGPGCARSLVAALRQWQPDCVLIEGPQGVEALLQHVDDATLKPPVALLSYAEQDPKLAVFHPFAEFSPEWQAIVWARQAGVPIRFMDVPPNVSLSWQQGELAPQVEPNLAPEPSPEEPPESDTTPDSTNADAPASPEPLAEPDGIDASLRRAFRADPLDALAEAAGFSDGESWWNHMVEERGQGPDLFAAIAEAMQEVRAQLPRPADDREDQREATMRQTLRAALKESFQRIAVICGAWHVPALQKLGPASADAARLKGQPKLKTQTTWVPWTHRNLAAQSGYGAGILAPGWYQHLWDSANSDASRAVGWYARVARLLRERDLDCSSAHLIEAVRLADTLAALHDRHAPGLAEVTEAIRSVICQGDDAWMRLIHDELLIGDQMGSVPEAVPTVPLQRDLEAEQKRLRLKPDALSRTLDLDLRQDTDRQRSQLLHRLRLLDLNWGELQRYGQSGRGTFHEIWTIAWQPSFQVELIVASRYGQTIAAAATARTAERAAAARDLEALAALVDQVMLADLPTAVAQVVDTLQARAAEQGDAMTLLAALPALANVYRYGNVRQTDATVVAGLFDALLTRATISLPLAMADLDTTAAEAVRKTVLAADRAVALRQHADCTQAWHQALQIAASAEHTAALLQGMATRVLLDAEVLAIDVVATQLQRALSLGAEPLQAAEWLDGFLDRNATLLLHDARIWPLVDAWLCGLNREAFLRVLPLVRRTFASFEAADRRDLAAKVQADPSTAHQAPTAVEWDVSRAERALPFLYQVLGVADEHNA